MKRKKGSKKEERNKRMQGRNEEREGRKEKRERKKGMGKKGGKRSARAKDGRLVRGETPLYMNTPG